jgi:hypothetical protein
MAIVLVLVVAGVAINIAILVWVYRDSRNRAMDNPALWLILVFFTGLIGLLIYIFSRPKGMIVPCAHCGNKLLQYLHACPHCGNPNEGSAPRADLT